MKKALITGITGQDGSYLAELLLAKGYEVHGIIRRKSTFGTDRIEGIYVDPHSPNCRLYLHYGDLVDTSRLSQLLMQIRPDEIYNLAAQSHVRVSFDIPEYTTDVNALGCVRLFEAVRTTGQSPRIYQASSSEMYGKVAETPQKESTPFYPRSAYAYAKLMGYWATVNAREAYGLHASNGILFNHESPRRKETFVTRKITRAISKILVGKENLLYLGNLEAKRDWGFAKEYVEAMWLMLQQDQPDDYVIATGETHSVQEFLDEAFGLVGLQSKDFVKHNARYDRPTEVDLLCGDASKARRKLKWKPKTHFKDLVRLMVEHDLALENLTLDSARDLSKVRAPKSMVAVPRSRKAKVGKADAIFVAGHNGLVGSAFMSALKADGYHNLVHADHQELDLLIQNDVESFFAKNKIDHVVIAAAKVGGIIANASAQADFLAENLLIASNIIRSAANHGVKRLVFLGSSCIYPKYASQPIREEALLTGSLEPSNEGYAIAKIAGLKLCEKYRQQYGKDFVAVMPTNLYGPGDNFDAELGHVIPALFRKFHAAKIADKTTVTLWGTGSPRREFLYVEDLGRALITVLEQYDDMSALNIGSGEEVSIAELSKLIGEVVGFSGKIVFDTSKPDGTPRKLLDSSRMRYLGWKPNVLLKTGLTRTYEWALANGIFEQTLPLKKSA